MAELTTEQAADRLSVCRRTLERWRERGVGPAYRRDDSGRYSYPDEAIDEYRERTFVRPYRERGPV
jgi:excisionase family DNA binding protein